MKVELLAYTPNLHTRQILRLQRSIEFTPNPEETIARAASTCYNSIPKELDKFIK